jgi:hypothetical protein
VQTRVLAILAAVGVLVAAYLLWDGWSRSGGMTGRAMDPLSAETEELTRWARPFRQIPLAKAETLIRDSFHDDVSSEQQAQHVRRIVPLLVNVAAARPLAVTTWDRGVVTATWKCRTRDGGEGQLSLLFSRDEAGRLRLLGTLP